MKPGARFFVLISLLALSYLTYANMRGYVPFASSVSHAARSASTFHFHK
jgi:hypothetical protein